MNHILANKSDDEIVSAAEAAWALGYTSTYAASCVADGRIPGKRVYGPKGTSYHYELRAGDVRHFASTSPARFQPEAINARQTKIRAKLARMQPYMKTPSPVAAVPPAPFLPLPPQRPAPRAMSLADLVTVPELDGELEKQFRNFAARVYALEGAVDQMLDRTKETHAVILKLVNALGGL